MILKNYKPFLFFLIIIFALFLAGTQQSCSVSYGFQEKKSIPDSIKIVKVNQFTNKATYVNPKLAPELTDKLRQKIVSQTRLTQTNGDDADWEITASITGYSFSTSAISNQNVTGNRINVGVHIEVNDKKAQKINKYDVTTPFDYQGQISLQEAERSLENQMIKDITDAIFNRIFSNW